MTAIIKPKSIGFWSEEFGEVDLQDIPASTPPQELQQHLEEIQSVSGLPSLRMQYVPRETIRRYCPNMSRVGEIGWGSAEQQLICVVESDNGLPTTKDVMAHEAVHALGIEHERNDWKFRKKYHWLKRRLGGKYNGRERTQTNH